MNGSWHRYSWYRAPYESCTPQKEGAVNTIVDTIYTCICLVLDAGEGLSATAGL